MSKTRNQPLLPESFEVLAPFVEKWAMATERERYRARLDSSMETLQAFYVAMLPQMEGLLTYLSKFHPEDLPPEGKTLLYLGCAFMDVSQSVERFGTPDVPESFPAERVQIIENPHFTSR